MSNLRQILTDVRHGSVWQITGAYVIGAWFALQAAETVSSLIGLPLWFGRAFLVFLLVGLPVIAITAAVQGRRARAGEESRHPDAAAERGSRVAGDQPSAVAERTAASESGRPPDEVAGRDLFTWRNALLAGVGALVLLGLGTGGHMAMRSLGIGPAGTLVAKGLLEERSRIILADFQNQTDDPRLGDVVTEALRVDLSESAVVELVEPAFLRGALERMERAPDTRLDGALAREVAAREGIPAVLTGRITAAGSGFQLVADLLSAEDGASLVSQREAASDPSEVLAAIDKLSKRIRERIGESLKTIRAAAPLEQVTTANLEALKLYSQAVRLIDTENDPDRGLGLLEEAVALDTSFAAAYRKIGVALGNAGEDRARQLEVLEKAFQHRDRLTRSERLMATGTFYHARGDSERAREAYLRLVELDPGDSRALNNLALEHLRARDFATAEDVLVRAIDADSMNAIPYANLLEVLVAQGKLAEAGTGLEAQFARFPGSPQNLFAAFQLAVVLEQFDSARALGETARRIAGGNQLARALAESNLGVLQALRGRFRESFAHLNAAQEAQLRRGAVESYHRLVMFAASIEGISLGDTASALARIEAALERAPVDGLPPIERPSLSYAIAYASLGEAARARAWLDEYERLVPEDLHERTDLLTGRAEIARVEGRHGEAVRLLHEADIGVCVPCLKFPLAQAFDQAGVADSALHYYESYLETPSLTRVYGDAFARPVALERLGWLYDQRGDLENAALYYARFVELWAEADPELQPRVEAAQARLQAIMEARG